MKNSICKIPKNEIIIYGKKENYLYFNYIGGNDYKINIDNIGDNISCKFLRSSRYLCAFFQNKKIKICIINLIYVKRKMNELKIFETKELENDSEYDNLILYDTNKEFYKIFCAIKTGNSQAKCLAIYAKDVYDSFHSFDIEEKMINLVNDNQEVSKEKHKCYMIRFNSEFLLCCADKTTILCQRRDKNFNSIKQFTLDLKGDISSIIINYNINHAIISYINEPSSDNYQLHYLIYPPKCKNVIIKVNSLQNLKIDCSVLFERKTNTIYYIKFENIPKEYGDMLIGEKSIESSVDYIIESDSEKSKLSFGSIKKQLEKNIIIKYIITIKETYSSSRCTINLNYVNENQINKPIEIIEEETTILEKEEEEDTTSNIRTILFHG